MKNSSLKLVEFADGFRGLTGLQIIPTVGLTPVDWYVPHGRNYMPLGIILLFAICLGRAMLTSKSLGIWTT